MQKKTPLKLVHYLNSLDLFFNMNLYYSVNLKPKTNAISNLSCDRVLYVFQADCAMAAVFLILETPQKHL